MGDKEERDWVRSLGTVLVVVGVGMWIPYAVGKYLFGWRITDRDFLPYHLAVIIPGMVLRYHQFFFSDLWRRVSRRGNEPVTQASQDRPEEKREGAVGALIIINNFVHDMFTGLWVSSVAVIYLLKRKMASGEGPLLSPVLKDVMSFFFWLGIASIVIILMTGSFRILYFRRETAPHERETKRKLLIVKHVFFTTVFIGGTYLAYLYAFK